MKEPETETLNRRWTQIYADKIEFRRGVYLRQSAFICGWILSLLAIFVACRAVGFAKADPFAVEILSSLL
jgi:hypothetical protein